MKVKSLSRVQLLATPWTAAYQAPLSMGFSRQDYWSGLPLPFLNVWVTVLQKSIICFLKYIPEAKQYGNLKGIKMKFSSVQLSTVAQSCPTVCNPMNRSTPGLPVHHQLPEFTQTHFHRVVDAIHPSHPLPFPFPPEPNATSIRVFSNESTLYMWWPKYWSFSFSIIPSKEHPGLICFRLDWLRTPLSEAIEINRNITVNILSLLFYLNIYKICVICII